MIDVLITPRCGQNVADVFELADIKIFKSAGSDAANNLIAYNNGSLEKLTYFQKCVTVVDFVRWFAPQKAFTEQKKSVGVLKVGHHQNVRVVTGILNLGETSGIPVIRQALKYSDEIVILDCPPGSACGVMESIMKQIIASLSQSL